MLIDVITMDWIGSTFTEVNLEPRGLPEEIKKVENNVQFRFDRVEKQSSIISVKA
jgi:hypothetical protein